MAYDASKQRDFLTRRIHEWADILEMRHSEERDALKRQWEEYYGEDHPWRAVMYLNLYELTQGYGGPEEGGWWYTEQEPQASVPITDRTDAFQQLDKLIKLAEDMYGDSRPMYSAAGGEDGNIVLEPHVARAEPAERPHYC